MKGRKLLLEKQQKEIKLHVFTSQESTQHKDAPQESGCLSYKKRKKLSVCMENMPVAKLLRYRHIWKRMAYSMAYSTNLVKSITLVFLQTNRLGVLQEVT